MKRPSRPHVTSAKDLLAKETIHTLCYDTRACTRSTTSVQRLSTPANGLRRQRNSHCRPTTVTLLLILVLHSLLLHLTTANHHHLPSAWYHGAVVQPLRVGWQSALQNSRAVPFRRRHSHETRTSCTTKSTTSLVANLNSRPLSYFMDVTRSNQGDDEQEVNEQEVQTAFAKRRIPLLTTNDPMPDFELEDELRAMENAYLTKTTKTQNTKSSPTEASELDYLESLVPCSRRIQTVPTNDHNRESPKIGVSSASTGTTAVLQEPPLTSNRGGATNLVPPAGAASAVAMRPLSFWENMVAGAISRSVAQTIMHPANTMKTMLQKSQTIRMVDLLHPRSFKRLTTGAGANFLLSVPHGAVNFAVLEFVRRQLAQVVENTPALSRRADSIGPGLDFMSSAISTITCSVVSTPQMMITDNIMAGNYPNLFSAVRGLAKDRGIAGFYSGWWPGLVGKIPSYALTWTFFQQLKLARDRMSERPATDVENAAMGCLASGTTVCIMIPLDTIKTRLVTQTASTATDKMYKGIVDCAVRIVREEGAKSLYRGLAPRLVSVVPMIGIQFGVYEFMKKVMLDREKTRPSITPLFPFKKKPKPVSTYDKTQVMQEAAMEVAASPEQPYPAPQFIQHVFGGGKKKRQKPKQKAK